MINVVNVTQHYSVRPVLRQVNLEVKRGELVAVLGPNGMGKSTLLSVIAGVLSPQKGHVEIDSYRRRGSIDDELEIRKRVCYVPDHPWLPANRTGREFMLGIGALYDVDCDRLMQNTDRLLELFDLNEQGDWPIKNYSNGQKHKIALCTALVCETPVLILDEAFSGGLDPAGILALKKILVHRTREQGAAVIIATPIPELVEEVADRIAVLSEGRIAAYDSLDGLREQTGSSGPLSDVLQKLIHPQTLGRLERYFEEQSR